MRIRSEKSLEMNQKSKKLGEKGYCCMFSLRLGIILNFLRFKILNPMFFPHAMFTDITTKPHSLE